MTLLVELSFLKEVAGTDFSIKQDVKIRKAENPNTKLFIIVNNNNQRKTLVFIGSLEEIKIFLK